MKDKDRFCIFSLNLFVLHVMQKFRSICAWGNNTKMEVKEKGVDVLNWMVLT